MADGCVNTLLNWLLRISALSLGSLWSYDCIHCFYHDTILTASTLECCYGLLEFFKLLLRTLSCLVAHEHLQYIATDCSFYQTPTPTAAARNESKSGLIISIEKKKMAVLPQCSNDH